MDENNCCVAARIFLEKNRKYIFPLIGRVHALSSLLHFSITMTLQATGTLLKTT
jgi:hypothetical protein